MWRRAKHTLAIAAVVVVAIAGAEGTARVAAPWYDPAGQLHFIAGPDRFPTLGPADHTVWSASTADGWAVKVRFDRFGFRQARDIIHSSPQSIFVVGDYFPFGWGVAEGARFPDLLAARLDVEVHDIAILGNLPQGDLKLVHYAESVGAPVHRLLLILPMEYGVQRYDRTADMAEPESEDDFPSESRLRAAHVSLAEYRKIARMWRVPYNSLPNPSVGSPTPPLLSNVKQWLGDHSALYQLSLAQLHFHSDLLGVTNRLGLTATRRAIRINAVDQTAIATTARLLREIADHYDLVVVVVPSPAVWIGLASSLERQRQAAFIAALGTEGVSYVDLLPVFDSAGGAALLYPHELIWNAAAHQATANALVPALASHWNIERR